MTHTAYLEELIGSEVYAWTAAEVAAARALATRYDTAIAKEKAA